MYDLVINKGHVIDPANRISARLNLGITNGKIAGISDSPLEGAEHIDASGLIVSPGFVDIHIHEDQFDTNENSFKHCITHTMLLMGVTSAIGGNCGISTGYVDPVTYLKAVDNQAFPINLAMLATHDVLRRGIGATDIYQSLSETEIAAMIPQLKKLLDGGCIGFSMGLQYIPGTSTEEMKALIKIAGEYRRVTSIHMRYEAKQALTAIEEMIDVAGGAALQISHIGSMCAFGYIEESLSLIDHYKAKGLNVEFDCYPYYAYCTTIGSAVFDDGFLENMGMGEESYQKLEIASGSHRGERCTKSSFHTIRKTEPEALVIAHVMNEAEIDRAITHPGCIVASDGIFINRQGHPRAAGTFPRFIHEYVRMRKMLSLEEAIGKITCEPAQRFGLKKGTLAISADADITIFDYTTIKDGATFMEPTKKPEGIEYVLIGGKIAVKNAQIVNAGLGKSIRF